MSAIRTKLALTNVPTGDIFEEAFKGYEGLAGG
jgi:hypothetical protein